MSRRPERSRRLSNARLRQSLRALSRRLGLNSIQGRLTSIAVFFILGTALIMGLFGFRFAVDFERQRFADHFQLLATNLAGNAELGVLLGNRDILQGLTDNMLALRDVERVEILDNQGQILIRRQGSRPQPQLGFVSAPVFAQTLDVDQNPFLAGENSPAQPLGEVRIGYSLAAIDELKRQLAGGFVLLSLLLGMVPLFFYWRLSKAIRAPLQDVLDVAGKVSRGQMTVRAEGGTLQETETLARAFNEMLDALQQQRRQIRQANEEAARQRVLAEVGKFSLTVAHEIKNPLAIINGSLAILRRQEPVDPELKTRMFGYIDEEIVQMNRLIEDFLLFARPQATALQPLSVADIVRQLSQRLRLLDADVRIDDQLDDAQRQFQVLCDQAQFERALFNVIRNALEMSPEPGSVSIQVTLADPWLNVAVKDSGPGVNKAQQRTMFDPFVTTKAKGTGLGLAIAQDVITAHQGQITVSNNPDGGACFTLSLPLAAAHPPCEVGGKANAVSRGVD